MRQNLPWCCVLVVITCLAYYGLAGNSFINFDDPIYIVRNLHVRSGLTIANMQWAFTSVHAANWHPLTWISHMADVSLWGMKASGHHLTSLGLHVATTVLLYLLLWRITGRRWPSLAVAALFGVHPLHVESVAWAAERKDVLSGLLFMATLHAYVSYVRRPGLVKYAVMVLLFACGLMAKPMLITLPVILLLLDRWPLERYDTDQHSGGVTFARLLLEKLPLFVLALASGLVTLYAQQAGDTVATLVEAPFSLRLANAMLACCGYLAKLIWPVSLSVFYPLPQFIPLWQIAVTSSVCIGFTLLAILTRHRRPYLFVGWFWYVCTLIPVIGLVQVGSQSMADRYMYLPMTGLLIALVWASAEVGFGRRWLIAAFITAVTACSALTIRQIRFWHDDIALYTHSLDISEGNYVAHINLGCALGEAGRHMEAIEHFRAALRISPANADAHYNLGDSLLKTGQVDEALVAITNAIRLRPGRAVFYNELGACLQRKGDLSGALDSFDKAIQLDPELLNLMFNKAQCLIKLGRIDEAVTYFQRSLEQWPDDAECHYRLALALASLGRTDEAGRHFSEARRLNPVFGVPAQSARDRATGGITK